MSVLQADAMRRFHFVGALAVLGSWAIGVGATDPDHHGRTGAVNAQAPLLARADATPAPPEDALNFEMRNKLWSDVWEWLADNAHLPVINPPQIEGKLNFYSPTGRKKYTIPEVIDILNEALLDHKPPFLILRRATSFKVVEVPKDGKIDPNLAPTVRLEDLDKHGKTEVVSVLLPLSSLLADDVKGEVKEMLGPIGNVVSLPQSNQLLLVGPAGNLKRTTQTLKDNEQAEKAQGGSLSYECKYMKAKEAASILKEVLGVAPQGAGMFGRAPNMAMTPAGPGGPSGPAGAPAAKQREVHVSADERTNTVLVTGPADKIVLAKQFLAKMDVPHNGQDPVLLGPPRPELILLNTLEAAKVIDTLKEMFNPPSKGPSGPSMGFGAAASAAAASAAAKGPYLEAVPDRNAIFVQGTPEQISAVKEALKALGEDTGNPGRPAGNMLSITLDKGNAITLAEALKRMLPQLRKNPVRVVIPGSDSTSTAEPPKDNTNGATEDGNGVPQLIDPQATKVAKNDRPGKEDVPITLAAFGDKLIATSDDPQALQLVRRLSTLLQTKAGEGDFQVVRLKFAKAPEAAQTLDALFNDTRQNRNNFNPFGIYFGMQQRQKEEPRIRVVADPATNSLLVRASPLDMLTVRRLVEQTIDLDNVHSKAIIKIWKIGPLKYANAEDVSSTIKELYREHLNNTLSLMQSGALRNSFIYGGLNTNVDANGNPRTVDLTVTPDKQTNTLLVGCTEAMYNDIKKLVEDLDTASKDSTRTLRVIPIKNIDPVLLQQALDAIQGRRSNGGTRTPSTGPPASGGGASGSSGNSQSRGPDFFADGVTDDPKLARRENAQGGPGFFADGVTDDPQSAVLYDPQCDPVVGAGGRLSSPAADNGQVAPAVQPVKFEEQQQPQPSLPSISPPVRGPRGTWTVEALPELGVVVVSASSPADLEEALRLIEFIQRIGAVAEIQIQVVELQHADATSVANTLTQVYKSVIVNPAGNVRAPLIPPPGRPGAPAPPTPAAPPTAPTPPGGVPTGAAPGAAPPQPQAQQLASVTLVPLPRINGILLAAPRSRIQDVVSEIKRLDRPSTPPGQAVPFPLRKASAARVDQLLTAFYNTRYPNEQAPQHQVRITHDDSTNTVFVQAAPSDLNEIRTLIERIDSTVSSAVNDLRIIRLNNALADELAGLLTRAIQDGVGAPTTPAGPTPGPPPTPTPTPTGGPTPGPAPTPTPTPGPPLGGGPGRPGTPSKTTTLRFISARRDAKQSVESGMLEDIYITPDARTNSLIISAPERTMELLLALIRDLDVLPAARAEINIFQLRRADATAMANLLAQLFLGTGGGGAPRAVPGPVGSGVPGGPGFPGGPGGFPTAPLTAAPTPTGPAGAPGGPRPLTFTLGGTTAEGAPLIELRITVDDRTNSLIVAGSRNDLTVIEAIISRLEDTEVQARRNEVYHLRNSSALDVANALSTFLTRSLQVLTQGGQLTAFQEIQRDVVVIPEPITNKLLISATPRYFADVIRLIQELDSQPPQVVIQVLIAEVDLTATEEFGVEFGLQSPVLFRRSVGPTGVTVNTAINPATQTAFNFNNLTLPLANNFAANPGIVGFQGLGNLGVGRASATSNVGGFVFSAASETFNLLIRALKTQGRVDVLSRPQIMTLDNQAALINIGQEIPIVASTFVTATGVVQSNIDRRNVGVILQVVPRVNPDGTVLMRVAPEVSSVLSTMVPLGNNQFGTSLNIQHVETTVLAADGETVAIGGLIQKRDQKNENKIPWVGDLPYVGTLFRFRTQNKTKTELLVILTPHIIRSPLDADRILAEEARRMDWVLGDVVKVHGTTGLEPIFPQHPAAHGAGIPGVPPNPALWPSLPGPAPLTPGPPLADPAAQETLPPPRTVPGPQSQGPAGAPGRASWEYRPAAAPQGVAQPAFQPQEQPPATGAASDNGSVVPPEPPKEKRGWDLFQRKK